MINGLAQILVVVESDPKYAGKNHLPGGKCNVGETRHACAIREVQEEVNIDLRGHETAWTT